MTLRMSPLLMSCMVSAAGGVPLCVGCHTRRITYIYLITVP